jgi:hypothetical protein
MLLLSLLLLLSACDAVDSMKQGLAHSQAVANTLKSTTGIQPQVSFNWHNGALTTVQITFQEIPRDKSLPEIYALSRRAIEKHFKEKPGTILISFAMGQ